MALGKECLNNLTLDVWVQSQWGGGVCGLCPHTHIHQHVHISEIKYSSTLSLEEEAHDLIVIRFIPFLRHTVQSALVISKCFEQRHVHILLQTVIL